MREKYLGNCTRTNGHMRARIGMLLAEGFSISGREPVRIERGRQAYEVRGNLLVQA